MLVLARNKVITKLVIRPLDDPSLLPDLRWQIWTFGQCYAIVHGDTLTAH